MDWQPIETAPKNNTRILLWYPWTGKAYSFAPAGFHYIAIWTCTDEGELAWRDADDFGLIGPDPTHWMPLPEPPPAISAQERETEL